MPALALMQAGFLDGMNGVMVAALIVLSGTYRLAYQAWAQPVTAFDGFPAAWGVVGFALHAFDATRPAAALLIGAVLILNLVPIAWPHPVNTTRWTALTRIVTLLAVLEAADVLWHGFPAGAQAKTVLIAFALYAAALAAYSILSEPGKSEPATQGPALDLASLDGPEPNDHNERRERTGSGLAP